MLPFFPQDSKVYVRTLNQKVPTPEKRSAVWNCCRNFFRMPNVRMKQAARRSRASTPSVVDFNWLLCLAFLTLIIMNPDWSFASEE